MEGGGGGGGEIAYPAGFWLMPYKHFFWSVSTAPALLHVKYFHSYISNAY